MRLREQVGLLLGIEGLMRRNQHRAQLVAEIAAVMQDVDLLVMPTWAEPAPRFGTELSLNTTRGNYTQPFNVTGNPALSVCSGFSSAGLPLSMQIVGRPFEDHLVLRLGHAFEQATSFRSTRPGFATNPAAAVQAAAQ